MFRGHLKRRDSDNLEKEMYSHYENSKKYNGLSVLKLYTDSC